MVTHLVKHITPNDGTSPNRVLVSRVMGKIGGKVKPARAYSELKYSYNIDPANGDPILTANTLFPSGEYDALDFTPSWSGHRFIGWFKSSLSPSASIPDMSGEITKDDSIVYAIKTIYAHWQLPTTITFDATSNGGVMSEGALPLCYAGQPYGELPKPTHESLNFTGWYDSNGNRITADSIVPEGGARIVARYSASSFSVSLNDEWEIDESINPNLSTYDGVYRSFSNTGYEDNENYLDSMAKMYIDVVGYTHLRIYIASNSESGYDYVVAMKPDIDPEYPPEAAWGEIPEDVMASTSDYSYADPSNIDDYIPVDYELDGEAHRICIVYRKDGSVDVGEDCGYVLIPKEQ